MAMKANQALVSEPMAATRHETRLSLVEKDVAEIKGDVSSLRSGQNEIAGNVNTILQRMGGMNKFGVPQIIAIVSAILGGILACNALFSNPLRERHDAYQSQTNNAITKLAETTQTISQNLSQSIIRTEQYAREDFKRVDDNSIRRHDEVVTMIRTNDSKISELQSAITRLTANNNRQETQLSKQSALWNLDREQTRSLIRMAWPKDQTLPDSLRYFPDIGTDTGEPHSEAYPLFR